MAANRYEETVPASPWFNWLIYVVVIALLVVGGVILSDGSISGSSQVLSTVILLVVIILLVMVSVIFARLHIKVGEKILRFNFGPLGRTITAGEIVSVEVEPYRWLTYGGWGIRGSTKGCRAFSVPFCNRGVSVQVLNGPRYHISSKSPDRFAEAVRGIMLQH